MNWMPSLKGRVMMKININTLNPSLVSIFQNPTQIITLDANFLIPPDRSRYAKRLFSNSCLKGSS